MTFDLFAWRFFFVAREHIHFPPGKASNVLRGAFGSTLRRTACDPGCPGPGLCARRAECEYARLFEPSATGSGPSGLANWPRPFVLRTAHLDGRTIRSGDEFHFDMHVFELKRPSLPALARAFAEFAIDGLGPGRGTAELSRVSRLDASHTPTAVLFEDGKMIGEPECLRLSLEPLQSGVRRIVVRFATPTELKAAESLAEQPEFGVLFARVRDRISTLRTLYGAGPLDIDFRALGARAAVVRMVRCELRKAEVERRSARTGQVHSLGGFIGEAEYEGQIDEFLPYLLIGEWTGVGRQTVWGKGEIQTGIVGRQPNQGSGPG